MAETSDRPFVIVVNSLVARGSVGGRASLSVLERMGYPVWLMPTMQLAWHPGHGPSTRIVAPPKQFAALMADLAAAPWLDEVAAILTGYLGGVEQVDPIRELVAALKARRPDALYLCDPIAGDSGGLYQPEPLVEAIRDRLLPLADIATPNRYELAWYAGRDLPDNDAIVAAMRALKLKEAVVTSAFAPAGEIGNLLVAGETVHLASHRRLDAVPHGTGDALAVHYLSLRLGGAPPADALDRSVTAIARLVDLATTLRTDELPLVAGGRLLA